jgi:hypothetical protein
MTQTKHGNLTWMLWTMLLGACSSIDTDNSVVSPEDKGDPIWTIHAAIEGDMVKPNNGEVRAAFIWQAGSTLRVAEDIVISDATPMSLDLGIYDMPDPSWLISSEESYPFQFGFWGFDVDADDDGSPVQQAEVLWTKGKLVLYVDDNQNGELDLLELGETDAQDTIIGGAFAYEFYYIEGDAAHPFALMPTIENGLVVTSAEVDYEQRESLDLNEEITLRLDNSATAQLYMCPEEMRKHWIDGNHIMDKQCTVVAPSEVLSYFPSGILLNVNGHCTDDGTIFEWFETASGNDGVCSEMVVHGDYFISRVPKGEPLPDYWPCTAGMTGMSYVVELEVEGRQDEIADGEACFELTQDLADAVKAQSGM